METLYLILGIAIAIWILTSKKFRKQIGTDTTESLTIASKTMKDSLRTGQINNILDFEEELVDRGMDLAKAKASVKEFDDMFK